MSDIPTMPKDWWPKEMMVVGRDGSYELAFAITKESICDGLVTAQIMTNLEGLRSAMWQEMHAEPILTTWPSFADIKKGLKDASLP